MSLALFADDGDEVMSTITFSFFFVSSL